MSDNPFSAMLSLFMDLKFPGFHPIFAEENLLLWLGGGCPIASEFRCTNDREGKPASLGILGWRKTEAMWSLLPAVLTS